MIDCLRPDFIDLCFSKDNPKETFWPSVETFSLLSDQNFWQKKCPNKNNVFVFVAY